MKPVSVLITEAVIEEFHVGENTKYRVLTYTLPEEGLANGVVPPLPVYEIAKSEIEYHDGGDAESGPMMTSGWGAWETVGQGVGPTNDRLDLLMHHLHDERIAAEEHAQEMVRRSAEQLLGRRIPRR